MATKHLYECEDVGATLLYGIVRGEPIVAVRAAKELLDSEEHELLHKLLTLAWLLDSPDHPYESQRAQAVCDHNTEQLFYLLATTMPMIAPLPEKSDAPAPAHGRGTATEWTKHPRGWSDAQAATALRAIQYALRKQYWQHAAYLAGPLIYGNTYALVSLLQLLGVKKPLIELLETTVFGPLAERILAHAFASLVHTPTQAHIQPRLRALWNAKLPVGKAGRLFTIPPEARSMWRVRAKPVTRLMGNPHLIADEDACAYWRKVVQTYGIRKEEELVFANDEERFYDDCFPDDIPDEWSNEERAKSHGPSIETTLEWHPWQTAFLLCWS
jgi:hypothetical protein